MGLDARERGEQIRSRVGYMPEHDCLPADVTATEFVTHLGRMFYFCCAGCRTSFAGDPARYLTGAGAT